MQVGIQGPGLVRHALPCRSRVVSHDGLELPRTLLTDMGMGIASTTANVRNGCATELFVVMQTSSVIIAGLRLALNASNSVIWCGQPRAYRADTCSGNLRKQAKGFATCLRCAMRLFFFHGHSEGRVTQTNFFVLNPVNCPPKRAHFCKHSPLPGRRRLLDRQTPHTIRP